MNNERLTQIRKEIIDRRTLQKELQEFLVSKGYVIKNSLIYTNPEEYYDTGSFSLWIKPNSEVSNEQYHNIEINVTGNDYRWDGCFEG